jgi:hypothetical protein
MAVLELFAVQAKPRHKRHFDQWSAFVLVMLEFA